MIRVIIPSPDPSLTASVIASVIGAKRRRGTYAVIPRAGKYLIAAADTAKRAGIDASGAVGWYASTEARHSLSKVIEGDLRC